MGSGGQNVFYYPRHPLISIDSLSSDWEFSGRSYFIWIERRGRIYEGSRNLFRKFSSGANNGGQTAPIGSSKKSQERPEFSTVNFGSSRRVTVIMQAFSATPHKNVKWVQEIAPTHRARGAPQISAKNSFCRISLGAIKFLGELPKLS